MGIIIDPPSGWKYGFPKELPENVNIRKFLLDNGYPASEVDFALTAYRMWTTEPEKE